MSAALRKGWCPGALRPMAAKDGLIVRLRITGGILPADIAHALADLAAWHGNGLFDLSARGNLQMRGVRDATLRALQDSLQSLGLIDATEAAEAVRNVIASPLAGLHGGLDIRPLVAALERRLADDTALHALPSKFGFLIDDGSHPMLAGIDADVRFDWTGAAFSIGLGGTRAEAARIGMCDAFDLVGSAARIARGVLAVRVNLPEARRMRDLFACAGPDAVARACGGRGGQPLPLVEETIAANMVGLHTVYETGVGADGLLPPSSSLASPPPCGEGQGVGVVVRFSADREARPDPHPQPLPARGRGVARHIPVSSCLGLAAPFGRLDAAMLRAAADIAETTTVHQLRLTPWRAILIPGATAHRDVPGFITDPDDSRLAVAACVGAAGCARGSTDTHADASRLAAGLDPRAGIALHVSGCEKGCAKPSRTAVTLVARDGRYDLVRDGRAGDAPCETGLDLAAARRRLEDARALA